VRDYVHVSDLAEAHVAALEGLPAAAGVYNLGTATGNSVLDVVRAVAHATARTPEVRVAPRRAGDPAALVASYERACAVLGWRPRRSLARIVADAWAWLSEHPAGYDD